MTFSSMWPLAFIVAIPIIIILYLLKPKGKDETVPSNILWERLFKNIQSKTFFEKFVHNILMYIQIVIMLLLILALMSPYIKGRDAKGQSIILVIDASGSMQHKSDNGVSRFDEAKSIAEDLINDSDSINVTIVSVTDNASILAGNSTDEKLIQKTIKEMEATDLSADYEDAVSVVKTLYENNQGEKKSKVILLSDSAEAAQLFRSNFDADIYACGRETSNLSLDYLSLSKTENESKAVIAVTNYGSSSAVFDAAIYDQDGKIISMSEGKAEAGKNSLVIFEGIDSESDYYRAEISKIEFSDGSVDSLEKDNTTYYITAKDEEVRGCLIGSGNTFIEKAFTAITGEKLTRLDKDSDISGDEYNFSIYDAGSKVVYSGKNRLVFAGEDNKKAELTKAMARFTDGKLSDGFGEYEVGANKLYSYNVPDWADSFITSKGEAVGYFGEHDGIKEIVLGFDIRESDFALSAEYPIFMANCIGYLSGNGILATNSYTAGEKILLNPTAEKVEFDVDSTNKAGLYTVKRGDAVEYYQVVFPIALESDGKMVCQSEKGDSDNSVFTIKKSIRTLLLIVALLLLLIEGLIFIKQMNYKGRFYYFVRAAVVIFIVLAIADISVSKKSEAVTTIFVVDMSESNAENIDEIASYIKEAVRNKPRNNSYGIVTFGKNQAIEQFITSENSFVEFMSSPDNTATNLKAAIERAAAMIDSSEAGRIVIMTDGKETKGDISTINSAYLGSNIEYLLIKYDSSVGKDAFISDASIPGYLHKNDKYKLKVSVESNYEVDATINLKSGSKVVSQMAVHLTKGTNQYQFDLVVMDDQMESYTLTVEAEGDTVDKNNSYSVYSMVESTPRVLVLSGSREDSKNFNNILSAMSADYTVSGAKNAPDTLQEMLKYKTIILENVYRKDLPQGFLDNIDTYVKDYGCGVIMTGGQDSYALGGYRDTEIEDVLPVSMDITSQNEIPSMAMIMVIDHSGSMISPSEDGGNATNLDIAIQAACDAVDNLRATDYVGVLTFDDRYEWQVKPIQASDKEKIKKEIQSIKEGGGTTIKPALAAAYNSIVDLDVQIKHIVLLTDGMGETDNFSDVTGKIYNAGVTLSTVAVGTESDTRLLERLADDCNGRYYYAEMSADIPKIFAQEVFLSSESFIQDGNFKLAVNSGNDICAGLFEEGWSNILAYIKTTPKQTSTVIIESEKGDPILATWRYGLGYAVAWTTDVSGNWTPGYASSEDYVQLWKRMIDFTEGGGGYGEDEATVETINGRTMIKYNAVSYSADTTINAYYTGPDGEGKEVSLKCIAPGVYESELPDDQVGLYSISVRREDAGEVTNSVNTAAVVQFSDEYRFDISSDNLDSFIASNGKMAEDIQEIWRKPETSGRRAYSLRNLFIILSIIALLYDIAVRRFGYEMRFSGIASRIHNIVKSDDVREGKKQFDNESFDMIINETENEINKENNTSNEKKPDKKSDKKSDKKNKTGNVNTGGTLDTSALLKKKDDRNI